MKKKVTAVFKDEIYDFYFNHFRKPEEGAMHVLECFPRLFENTIKETAGIFTRNELCMILDIFEGMSVSPSGAGECLRGECLEAVARERAHAAWNVDKKDFEKKLELITFFQAECLEIWAQAFWSGQGGKAGEAKTDDDLEKHIEVLL